MKNFKYAFTLAETLLALAIIGVIVVMTILVVMQDTSGKETLIKVQKSYSVLSNAFENALTKYGQVVDWDEISTGSFERKMNDTMLAARNCGTANNLTAKNDCVPGCPSLYTIEGSLLNTCTSSNVSKMMTADGFSYAFQIEDIGCATDVTGNTDRAPSALKQVCGTIMVDIYATKKGREKNIYGSDLFLFYITREGILPVGLADDKKFPFDKTLCKKKVTQNLPGCTSQYIYDKHKIEE